MNHRLVCLLIIMFFVAVPTDAQINYKSLPWRMNTAYNNHLMRDVHRQYLDRQDRITAAFTSEEAMQQYRDECIRRYKSIVGGFPGKSDLNARIVGVSQQDGFRIEKIIFESLPNRYVTANLYIPDGEGPFPVTLQLCGHGLGGKIPAPRGAILLALNKIAVLVVDPIGQGERIQFVDENSQSLTRGATTEHTLLNNGANLLGTSVAAYEYWDNHRAIDYLETREDMDKDRIGVFGSSGGGTQTSYMLGLDERIKVASVCSYFSQRQRVLELYGPSDGCQHIPYEGREQLEIADFVLMMAPKPVLIMSGKYDFVDYWGALQGFRELEKAYDALGSPEKVSMFSTEGGHGMPQAKREALATWFRRWMYNDPGAVKETGQLRIAFEDLRCTSTGQVLTAFEDAVSIPEYHRKLYQEYEKNRIAFLQNSEQLIRDKVMELLGMEWPEKEIYVEETGIFKERTYDIIKYQIIREGQMPVPVVALYPEAISPESDIVLYLHDGVKEDILSDENTIMSFLNQNQILMVADLRGFGETADPISLNDTKYWNREYRNAMTSMHIGKPNMGQRVIDIISLLDFTGSEDVLKNRNVNIIANGSYGPAVVHAAYLDQRINKAEISRSAKSFYEYLEYPMMRDIYSNVLYGVVKYYELKDLVALSGNGRVRFVD